MKKTQITLITAILFLLASNIFVLPVQSQSNKFLNPITIPKWVNQIEGPLPTFVPANITDNNGNVIRQDYEVSISEFYQQILPATDSNNYPTGFGSTKVWGYGGPAKDTTTGQYLGYIKNTPGPTFDAIKNLPIRVKWINNLIDSTGKPLSPMFAVDPTIHWANPGTMTMPTPPINAPAYPPGYIEAQNPVPIVTHLHGSEVPPAFDGGPDAWFTANGIHGPSYNTAIQTQSNAAVYEYPNTQEPTTLWYHDHALGMTRLNILSGLVGFYPIREPNDPIAAMLPKEKYDIPLCIQDRTFLSDGSLFYPSESNYPQIHPYWQSSFLGDTIIVNGKVWPNMNVEQGIYRFRILDASNSRFYLLGFSNGMSFVQIGSDGGYLKTPAPITTSLIAPGERVDVLVDFSNLTPGTKVILQNSVLTSGSDAEKQTIGQIMQFTVTSEKGLAPQNLPAELNPTLKGSFPTLQNATKQRTLTLVEASGDNGTIAMYLDGQEYNSPISETPELGSTEEWIFANPTISAHPIHLHLVQFQIISRQMFNDTHYMTDWTNLNGPLPLNHSTINLPELADYLTGPQVPPAPNEQGWKDTALMYAGQITTIRVRFARQDGSAFLFDPTSDPGYVWHCHLLEHEDNEMMRPLALVKPTSTTGLPLETIIAVAMAAAIVVVLAFAGLRYLRHRTINK